MPVMGGCCIDGINMQELPFAGFPRCMNPLLPCRHAKANAPVQLSWIVVGLDIVQCSVCVNLAVALGYLQARTLRDKLWYFEIDKALNNGRGLEPVKDTVHFLLQCRRV